jgi:hypothetical protein
MFQFNHKIVFIISPERWGQMKISKHHYAIELAKLDCTVYFIEPPGLSNSGVIVEDCTDNPNIKIVRYKPVYRAKRFLPKFIFHLLLKHQINILLKAINNKPAVVWSFQGHLFDDLRWFNAGVNIFFAADSFSEPSLPAELYTSDIAFGVSDTIYKRIKESGRPAFQINHGLQEKFVVNTQHLLDSIIQPQSKNTIIVGYSGNLRMEALDRKMMMRVISNNPEIKFIFWGTYNKHGSNLGVAFNDSEVDLFINFLESSSNVELRGVVNSGQLQKEMEDIDMFWLCWNLNASAFWDGSNSHKLLEYLSTGKPVVSHYVSSYKDSNMLYMLPSKDNAAYELLFNNIVNKVKEAEDITVIKKRLSFAVNNSYKMQLGFIEDKINSIL